MIAGAGPRDTSLELAQDRLTAAARDFTTTPTRRGADVVLERFVTLWRRRNGRCSAGLDTELVRLERRMAAAIAAAEEGRVHA